MVESVVNEYEFEPSARLPLCDSSLEGREKYLLFEVTFYAKDICTKLQSPVTKKQVQQISFLILMELLQIVLDDKANSPHNPHLVSGFSPTKFETYASSSSLDHLTPGIWDKMKKYI